jgi:hypothetical protein
MASPKILTVMAQITPPPTINSNRILLSNISALGALNPKELRALAVYFRAKELAHDATDPLTNYDPATQSKVLQLIQDAKTVTGNIPTGDLMRASTVIDWFNCYTVFNTIGTDVEAIVGLTNMTYLMTLPEDTLHRIALYLRLEIGQ